MNITKNKANKLTRFSVILKTEAFKELEEAPFDESRSLLSFLQPKDVFCLLLPAYYLSILTNMFHTSKNVEMLIVASGLVFFGVAFSSYLLYGKLVIRKRDYQAHDFMDIREKIAKMPALAVRSISDN